MVRVYSFRPSPDFIAEWPVGYVPWRVIGHARRNPVFRTLVYKYAAELGLTSSSFDIEIVSVEKPCLPRYKRRNRKWGCVTYKVVRVWTNEDMIDKAQELARYVADIIINLALGGGQ